MEKRGKAYLAKAHNPAEAAAWWLVAVVVVFSAAVRIRLLGIPLERDEGEFAYMGQLLLQGIPPYKLACNMKLPGTYAAYAATMAVFGQTIHGIHIGLLLVNAAAIVLLFIVARRLFDPVVGVIASAAYAMMSLSYGILGAQAHATHFVVLFALAGTVLLLKALEMDRLATYFWAGVMFGLAILMKQPGVFFLLFAALYAGIRLVESRPVDWRGLCSRLGTLAAGGLVPLAVTCVALWMAGVWDRFWFWTVQYGHAYATEVPLRGMIKHLGEGISCATHGTWALWGLSAAGLTTIFWDRQVRANAAFLICLLVCSFAATSVGFYYRVHYFVLMLPSVALLTGCMVRAAYRLAEERSWSAALRALPFALFVIALGFSAFAQRDILCQTSPREVCRKLYGANVFPEALEVGEYLRSHSSRGDRVAVLGSEPEIYFYSGLRSATTYLYTFGLMEKQPFALRMQKDMIKEIETVRPRFLVSVVSELSWYMTPSSHKDIFYWIEDYCARHYERVGLIDMVAPTEIVYYWDKQAATAQPISPMYIEVYRRKEI